MSKLNDFFERSKLAKEVKYAKMVYKDAASIADLETRVGLFSIFDPPIESIPTKPGSLSENQIYLRRKWEKQDYAYQKLKIWEEKSAIDIAAAKTKWQKFWAYRRAPKCLRLEAKENSK